MGVEGLILIFVRTLFVLEIFAGDERFKDFPLYVGRHRPEEINVGKAFLVPKFVQQDVATVLGRVKDLQQLDIGHPKIRDVTGSAALALSRVCDRSERGHGLQEHIELVLDGFDFIVHVGNDDLVGQEFGPDCESPRRLGVVVKSILAWPGAAERVARDLNQLKRVLLVKNLSSRFSKYEIHFEFSLRPQRRTSEARLGLRGGLDRSRQLNAAASLFFGLADRAGDQNA